MQRMSSLKAEGKTSTEYQQRIPTHRLFMLFVAAFAPDTGCHVTRCTRSPSGVRFEENRPLAPASSSAFAGIAARKTIRWAIRLIVTIAQ